MQIIDSHCHIHDPEFASSYDKPVETILAQAKAAGVDRYICVGTSAKSSSEAAIFAQSHIGAYASLALHPHEVAEKGMAVCKEEFTSLEKLIASGASKIIAIGECGLDYYYHADPGVRAGQKELFMMHLDIAIANNLPLIFHIREAFDDFFAVLDAYAAEGKTIRGVVHSFTAHPAELKGCIDRGLYVGLNGIMTFTKDDRQLEAARRVPLDRLLLETDAPFLTPKPLRSKYTIPVNPS
jgi:TatD DNase family protein